MFRRHLVQIVGSTVEPEVEPRQNNVRMVGVAGVVRASGREGEKKRCRPC